MILMQIVIKWSLVLVFSVGMVSQMHAQQSQPKPLLPDKQSTSPGQKDRAYWSDMLYKMVSPVILNLAAGTLKQNMPMRKSAGLFFKSRTGHLSRSGRTYNGRHRTLACIAG